VASDAEHLLSVLPLDDRTGTPFEALTGFVAPAGCLAMGVVATGTARRCDRSEQPATPVLLVVLVDRTGRCVSPRPLPPHARVADRAAR
jgi:hypothetical protein